MGFLFSKPSPYDLLQIPENCCVRDIRKKYLEMREKQDAKNSPKKKQHIADAYAQIIGEIKLPSVENISRYLIAKERKESCDDVQVIQDFYDKVAISENIELLELGDRNFYKKVYSCKFKDATLAKDVLRFTKILQNMDIQRQLQLPDISIKVKEAPKKKKFRCKVCNKIFKNENKLVNHTEKCHSGIIHIDGTEKCHSGIIHIDATEKCHSGIIHIDATEKCNALEYPDEFASDNEENYQNIDSAVPRKEDEYKDGENDFKINKDSAARKPDLRNEGITDKKDQKVSKKINKNTKNKKNARRKEGVKKKQNEQWEKSMFLICGKCHETFNDRKALVFHLKERHQK